MVSFFSPLLLGLGLAIYMYNMKGVVTKPTCRIYSLCSYSWCVLFMVGGDLTSMRLATTFLAYL